MNKPQKATISIPLMFAFMAVSVANATLTAPQSLVALGQQADLIAVGSANGTERGGGITGLALTITRVIKGDPALAGQTVLMNLAEPGGLAGGIGVATEVKGDGIWFLQKSSGAWVVLPVMQGRVPTSMAFLPVSASAPIIDAYAYEGAESVSDKLAYEICNAIESATAPYPSQMYFLLEGPLDEINSSIVFTLYSRLSNSSVLQQQILGISGLVRGGSPAGLALAIKNISTFDPYQIESGLLAGSVRNYFRSTDSESVSNLGNAALNTVLPYAFREAAAHALAATHPRTALPYLAQLMNDPDINLRVEAIGGMGAFANGLAAQTLQGNSALSHLQLAAGGPYRTALTIANFAMGPQAIEINETRYLTFWQNWWTENRVNLGF